MSTSTLNLTLSSLSLRTVLFIENRPDGSQSVKQSVNGRSFSRSFGQSYSQSVSGVTRHNYAVLKFNVINEKDGVLEEGAQISITTVPAGEMSSVGHREARNIAS